MTRKARRGKRSGSTAPPPREWTKPCPPEISNRLAGLPAAAPASRAERVGRSELRTPPASYPWTGERSGAVPDRKSTRLNSSHQIISYAVFCLKKKKKARQD